MLPYSTAFFRSYQPLPINNEQTDSKCMYFGQIASNFVLQRVTQWLIHEFDDHIALMDGNVDIKRLVQRSINELNCF